MNKRKESKRKTNPILLVLPYLGIFLVAAGLIVTVIIVTSRREGDKDRQIQTIGVTADVETRQETRISEETGRTDEADPEGLIEEGESSAISKLIGEYFEAIKLADVHALERIIRPAESHESEEVLQKKAQRSEAYLNIECYTLPGPTENSWIVYVYYEEKYINIETPAPNMNRFYVCMDESGNYYIDKNARSEEYNACLEEIAKREDVNILLDEVNRKMEDALSSDANLRELMIMLAGGGESTAAGTTEGE